VLIRPKSIYILIDVMTPVSKMTEEGPMKKIFVVILSVMLVAVSILSAAPAMAAKPQDVIAYSNGFPSGLHFNLNIHGKNPETFTCPGPGGNSVFIAEYTSDYDPETANNTINYISDKRNGSYDFQVTDPCAMPDPYGDGDGAEVKIPWKVTTDEGDVIEVSGYYVFARILGKPNNGKPKNGEPSPSSMILYPNVVVEAENDANSTMPLGLITQRATYVAAPEGFVRFDPDETNTKGKPTGKSKATDITHLFTWSGWVAWGMSPDYDGDTDIDQDDVDAAYADALLDAEHYYWDIPDLDGVAGINLGEWILFHPDTNGDGDIDAYDVTNALSVASTYLDTSHYNAFFALLDQDTDTVVTVEEWLQYQATLGHAQEFTNEWIFNIADYVVSEQEIDNDGTKLLQIRFYPIETTVYTKPARIVVGKLTDPAGGTDFEFETNYLSENLFLNDGEAFISDSLTPTSNPDPYSYSITEILPNGWTLSDVTIIEDVANSPGWTTGETVYIKLDAEETVYVTFINTEADP